MLAELHKKMPGKCVAAGKERPKLVQRLLEIFQIARTFCTTLTEFHLFWSLVFADLESRRETDLLQYLRSDSGYFFALPASEAAAQYGFQDRSKRTQQVLCGAWWTAYCRAQPGSAAGTQPVEASHLHGFREALVDEEGGRLHHLPPGRFFERFSAVLQMQGWQLRKHKRPLADHPNGRDPTSLSSARLRNLGRSNAVELHSQKNLIHQIQLAEASTALVMPRTLLEWRDDAWNEAPAANFTITVEEAARMVRLATETDLTELQSLWRAAGIITNLGGRDRLCWDRWVALRHTHVVVLAGEMAARYWLVPNATSSLNLCPCNYFAITGRCEHEQCGHAILGTGSIDLAVVGRQPGRPAQLLNVASPRGTCAAAVWQAQVKAEEKKAAAQRALRMHRGYLPCPPSQVTPGPEAQHLTDHPASKEVPVPAEPAGAARPRGPSLQATDFDKVETVLNGRHLPPRAKIYFNHSGQARA